MVPFFLLSRKRKDRGEDEATCHIRGREERETEIVALSCRRWLILFALTLLAAIVMMYSVPALAQTSGISEDKVLAQAEKKSEEKQEPEEKKGKLEEQKTPPEEKRSAPPSTGSILLGVVVGALLIGGGLLARSRIGVGLTSSEEAGFVDVVRRVVLRPVEFFAGLRQGGNLLKPLLFALVCIEISAVLGWLLVVVGVGGSEPGVNPNPQNLGLPSAFPLRWPIASVILALIGGAIGIFIAAGIQQLLVRLIVGARNSGYAATFRVASYTQVTGLVNWIPIIGPLLALYGIYLSIVGIREIHGTTTGRAALVVLLPFAVVVVVLVILVVVGAALFFQR